MPLLKNPCDLWVITELLQELRPRIVIETGTHHGGSATYLADMARVLGIDTEIVTIDINPKWSYDPSSKRIRSLVGRSTDPSVFAHVKERVTMARGSSGGHVLALLDSDHSAANVLAELRLYSDLITRGSYIVVEDTIVNGHPSHPQFGPGPWEAVEEFLGETPHFVADRERRRLD
jgi:cephalosporin hydroxylase